MLWNNFTRLTLVSRTSPERLTIDIGLPLHRRVGTTAHETPCPASGGGAQAGTRRPHLPFRTRDAAIGHTPSGMSKYCIGMLTLRRPVKHDAFKEVLLKLDRIRAAA
ncbi:MAG: hypothetical protein IPK99_15500 [Flavobacteriales bacterium]|nr:hypothetical protein [Flavobacteriales bacterium]